MLPFYTKYNIDCIIEQYIEQNIHYKPLLSRDSVLHGCTFITLGKSGIYSIWYSEGYWLVKAECKVFWIQTPRKNQGLVNCGVVSVNKAINPMLLWAAVSVIGLL